MPAAAPPRIANLDVIRGVAVLGILAMHIDSFAMPAQAYFNPLAYGADGASDFAAWAAAFILVEGKMRGLFILLFGASLLLIVEGAERRGERPGDLHRRRMAWLAVFGMLHFALLWYGDILLHFAIVGSLAFAFRRLAPRRLMQWAAGLIAFQFAAAFVFAACYAFVGWKAALPQPLPDKVSDWAILSAPFAAPSAEALAADIALHRGEWAELVRHRLQSLGLAPLRMLVIGGAETLALMLIGMAGLKSGFLGGGWSGPLYGRIALGGLAIGAAGFAALALLLLATGFHPTALFASLFAATIPLRLVMVLGYAAAIILLARGGSWLVQRLAAAGRMAFTHYLASSIVMTWLFYGHGLGLYGRFDRAELCLFVAAAWAAMLAISPWWLARFRYGPLEWLWRSLARGRVQPMRAGAPSAA